MATREPIYAALWALIVAAPGIAGVFRDMGRLLRHIEDVSADEMPAIYLLQQGESWERVGKGIPPKRTLNASIVVYVATTKGDGTLPATLLNTAMDAIDTLFNDGTRVQTLGGLVEHAYIAEGEVRYYEGLLQDKSPLTIPVRILIP